MKKMILMLLLLGGLVLTALPASAAPFLLAQHGHGGHGGHGGRGGTVIVGGGWGWGWGWGWGYPGYGYGYGYDPAYGYGRPAWARVKTDVSPEVAPATEPTDGTSDPEAMTRTTTPMLRNRIDRARRETGSPPGSQIGEEIAGRPMRR